MRRAKAVSAHFRVEELRYDPGYSADIKTGAILHRGHVQLFTHIVYIHINPNFVKWFDLADSECVLSFDPLTPPQIPYKSAFARV